ncbi:hypothetical protein ABW20_dc0105796 [Dactylellina cionopaga]|nr:hypothetical protein ABW20_dc0105796 [Dactylellina cionopaga]
MSYYQQPYAYDLPAAANAVAAAQTGYGTRCSNTPTYSYTTGARVIPGYYMGGNPSGQSLQISVGTSINGTPIMTPLGSTPSTPHHSIRSAPPGYATANTSHINLGLPAPPVYNSMRRQPPDYRYPLETKCMAAPTELRYEEILRTHFLRQQGLEREANLARRRIDPSYTFWDPYTEEEEEAGAGCRCVIL